MIGILAALAYALLAWALWRSDGRFEPLAVKLLVGAWGLCLAGCLVPWSRRADAAARAVMGYLFVLVALGNLYGLYAWRPGMYLRGDVSQRPFFSGVVLAAIVVVSWLWPRMPAARLRFPLLLGLYVVLGTWMIIASPQPFIDVWYYEQRAAELLLHGQNPYAADYPNIYGHTQFFGAQLINAAGRIQSHTYPPLSVLLTLPGYLVGDVRFASVASVAGAAAFLVAALRRLGGAPGHIGELGAVALLYQSRSFYLIEQSWTEPFVALAACAAAYAMVSVRHRLLRLALAGFLSVKQYGLFWLPALLTSRRVRWVDLAWAVGLAAAIVLPFFLWNPSALWQGVVAYQFKLAVRTDALTVSALLMRASGQAPSSLLGFGAAFVTAALVAWRNRGAAAPVALERIAIGGASVFFAFFLFHKQAFFNYYWLVGVFACIAMTAAAAAPGEPAPAATEPASVTARDSR